MNYYVTMDVTPQTSHFLGRIAIENGLVPKPGEYHITIAYLTRWRRPPTIYANTQPVSATVTNFRIIETRKIGSRPAVRLLVACVQGQSHPSFGGDDIFRYRNRQILQETEGVADHKFMAHVTLGTIPEGREVDFSRLGLKVGTSVLFTGAEKLNVYKLRF